MNNLGIALAALGGLALALLLGSGRKFYVQGQVQYWDKSQVKALQRLLASAGYKESGTERVWELTPTRAAGAPSALDLVRSIQPKAVMVSSSNLLDPGNARRMVVELTIPEFANLVTGTEQAVLPWLV